MPRLYNRSMDKSFFRAVPSSEMPVLHWNVKDTLNGNMENEKPHSSAGNCLPCLQKHENGSISCNSSCYGINKNSIKCCQAVPLQP